MPIGRPLPSCPRCTAVGVRALLVVIAVVFQAACVSASEPKFSASAPAAFKQFCVECHGRATAEGQINLEQMTEQPSFSTRFKSWEKVAGMVESGRMPPKDMPQPSSEQRRQLVSLVRDELRRAAEEHAGDPGQVVLRRLTSAEYSYTIQDLTGLDLDLERERMLNSPLARDIGVWFASGFPDELTLVRLNSSETGGSIDFNNLSYAGTPQSLSCVGEHDYFLFPSDLDNPQRLLVRGRRIYDGNDRVAK